MLFAVAVTLASPAAFVLAVGDDRLALAPEPGGANVTVAPDTGLFEASLTVTCSCWPNCVLIKVDCVPPPVAATLAAAPAVLVRLKLADSPPTVAETM